jgi:hypothetical protein
MIMSLRAHAARQPSHNEEIASSRQTLLATTCISLCDALEARLQSADAARERGRLVAAVMSTVGGSNGE